MPPPPPAVSLGLPVHNGENYLAEAIASLLAQSWRDLELIICDNGSTDGTARICEEAAAADSRVRYVRHDRNLGAAANYNRCFALAHGRYFKWCAHDDICRPDYLARCLEVLESDPAAVLAYPQTIIIDAEGREVRPYDDALDLTDPDPAVRLYGLLTRKAGECNAVFGLIRADALARTRLIDSFVASDENLLAELAMLGHLRQVPEPLFLRRDHPQTSLRANPCARDVARWFDSAWRARIHCPQGRRMVEYARSAMRLKLPPRDRVRVLGVVLGRAYAAKVPLAREALGALREAINPTFRQKGV